MQAVHSSETLVTAYRNAQRHKAEDHITDFDRRESLKKHIFCCPSALFLNWWNEFRVKLSTSLAELNE
jgi:hypothetical protein